MTVGELIHHIEYLKLDDDAQVITAREFELPKRIIGLKKIEDGRLLILHEY